MSELHPETSIGFLLLLLVIVLRGNVRLRERRSGIA
jgi:hypothetical protein